ncbi:MAG: hypothetical protein K8R46_11705, partial [Pirellulales bacterium]|nr:hypothetical protein [Pirellulales bacterium]
MQGPQKGLDILLQELEPLIAEDPNSRFKYLSRLAYQHLLLGEIEQANQVLEQAQEKYEALEWKSDLVNPMNTLATVYYHLQKLDQAGEIWEKLLDLASLNSNQELLFRNNLAVIRIRTGREMEALAILMQVYSQARKHHLVILEQQSGTNMALLKLHQGQIAEAQQALTRCLQLAELTGNKEMIRNSHHNLGEALIAAGEINSAREQLTAALPEAEEVTLTVDNAETLLLLARLHLDLHLVERAQEYLEQAASLDISPESTLEYTLLQELTAALSENRDQQLAQISAALSALQAEEPESQEIRRLTLRERLLAGTPQLTSIADITAEIKALATIQERQELLALAAEMISPAQRDFSDFALEMNDTIPGLINLKLGYLQAEALYAAGETAAAGLRLSKTVELARFLVEHLPPDWQQLFLATPLPGMIKKLGTEIRNELENN